MTKGGGRRRAAGRVRKHQLAVCERRRVGQRQAACCQRHADHLTETPSNVLAVLAQLEEAKKKRRQDEIMEQLDVIHQRVILALEHYGIPGTLTITESEMNILNQSFLVSGFSAGEKKEEMEQKQQLLEMISVFLRASTQRKNLLHDILDWLNAGEITELPSDEDIDNTKDFLIESNSAIKEVFSHTTNVTGRIRKLGDRLLKEAGYVHSDDEDDSGAGRGRRQPQTFTPIDHVLHETQLLCDAECMQLALDNVKMTLEQSVRIVKTNQQKTGMRNAVKQFKSLLKALKVRFAESISKDDAILQLETDVNDLTDTKMRLQEEMVNKDKMIKTLDTRLMEAFAKTAGVEAQRLALENEKDGLEEMVHTLQREKLLAAARSSTHTRSSATLVTFSPQPSVHVVKQSPSAVIALREEMEELQTTLTSETARADDLAAQLAETQEQLAKLQEEMDAEKTIEEEKSDLKTKIKKEKAKFKVESLTNNAQADSQEREVERLKWELKNKDEMLEEQQQRLNDMRDELTAHAHGPDTPGGATGTKSKADAKRMAVRLRKDYEDEVNRLKTHNEKEKQRLAADMRRAENGHQEQLNNIHKHSLHLLRAINRFKGAVVVILEKENLLTAANEVQLVPDLPVDEAPSDTRQLFTQMVSSAVELLVTVEFKLAQALVKKRLEAKDKAFAKTFADRDLGLQVTASTRAKQTAESLVTKLKNTEEKLRSSETAIIELRKQQDKRFEEVSRRNVKLMNQYKTILKQMEVMKADFGGFLKGKEDMLKVTIKQRQKLTRVVDEQGAVLQNLSHQQKQRQTQLEQRYRLQMEDQHANLRLLQTALSDGLVTREMHALAVGVIKHSLILPLLRLRGLAERYVAFRRLQEVKAQLRSQCTDSVMTVRRHDLETYLTRVDEQLVATTTEWQAQHEQLQTQRRELFSHMSDTFEDMVSTTALLQILPLVRPAPPSAADRDVKAAESVTRSRARSLAGAPTLLPPLTPPNVAAAGMPTKPALERLWKLPDLTADSACSRRPSWRVPRLLDMEVNQSLRRAHRTLNPSTRRLSLTMATAEGYDYEDCIVRSLQELLSQDEKLPPQRPCTPVQTDSIFINKYCGCGSICTDTCVGH